MTAQRRAGNSLIVAEGRGGLVSLRAEGPWGRIVAGNAKHGVEDARAVTPAERGVEVDQLGGGRVVGQSISAASRSLCFYFLRRRTRSRKLDDAV